MSKYRIGQKLNVIVESIDKNGKAKFRVIKEDVKQDRDYLRPDIYNDVMEYLDNHIKDEVMKHGGDKDYWEKEENWKDTERFIERMARHIIRKCWDAGVDPFGKGDLTQAKEAFSEYLRYGEDALIAKMILGEF